MFAGQTIVACPIPIRVQELPLIKTEPPETEGGPFRISAYFADSRGQPTVQINRNEWWASAHNWDVESSGNQITVRQGAGNICLRIRSVGGQILIVDRLDMRIGSYHFVGDSEVLAFSVNGGRPTRVRFGMISHCPIGMSFN